MKILIYCPVCQKNGLINILGELVNDGLIVKRFHCGETKIISDQFIVVCGSCHEPIFFKRRANESINFGQQWIYRQEFGGTTTISTANAK